MKHDRPERPTRIDKVLVDRGLAETRAKAQALIMAGVVLVDEQRVEKSSELVPTNAHIRLKGEDNPASRYVGRGGLKLEAALREFGLDVNEWRCLDIGASTGGFTDCLLQHGAKHVTAVDVGHNQMDWRLRTDSRVDVREGVNARYLKPDDFTSLFELAVVDVSFISATKIMPAVVSLLQDDGKLIVLIKPQFEVGRGEVGKGGIVREPEKHARVIEEVNAAARSLGLPVQKVIESPIRGADGNVEFLALYERGRLQLP